MKITVTIMLLSCVSMAMAQSHDTLMWSAAFGGEGGDGGRGIQQTADGGYVVAGFTRSFGAGASDLYIVRTDGEGRRLWWGAYGGGGEDSGYSVAPTADGGFIATGFSTSFGDGDRDLYLLKVDNNGAEQWRRTFGGPASEVGRSVIETADRGLVICGTTSSFGAGEDDVYLIKTDALGNELWARTFGGEAADNGRSVVETSGGDLVLTGATGSFGGGNRDVLLIRTDADGGERWRSTVNPSPYFDWGNCVIETNEGGFVTTGSGDVHGADLLEVLLGKSDADGALEWATRLGEGGFYDYGSWGLETVDGDLLVVGATKDPATLVNSAMLRKLDGDGSPIWTEIVSGEGPLWALSVVETADGYVVAGHVGGDSTGTDLWIAKVSNVTPAFSTGASSGMAPLEVVFTDDSTGQVDTWSWDLDGDGQVDSEAQNPAWVYDDPGVYTVQLEVTSGEASRTAVAEALIYVSATADGPRRAGERAKP